MSAVEEIAPARSIAIADGVLVDVTADARRAGFVCPVAFTRAAYWAAVASTPIELEAGLWPCERLRHVLDVMRSKMRGLPARVFEFTVWVAVERMFGQWSLHMLEVLASPGDDGEFVLTIALPAEN